jgi:uncharacterized protein
VGRVTRSEDPRAATDALDAILRDLGSVVVAYSGGIDSTVLALRAHLVLGSSALAVTADSESFGARQRELATEIAGRFGFAHRVIRTSELADPLYARNESDRCYRCKTELFRHLLPLARTEGYAHVAYGLIVDDLSDFRPGHRAATEAGVRSPLAEAGLGKESVRALGRDMGLPNWDLPASPCLSSRIPYGMPVTEDALRRIEAAEAALAHLGFREFRVRHLADTARVEIAPGEMWRLDAPGVRAEVERVVAAAGYRSVLIDPEGYRKGRLNDSLRVIATT